MSEILTDNTADQQIRPLTSKSQKCRPSNKEKVYITLLEAAKKYNMSRISLYRLIKTDPSFPYVNMGLKKKYMICPDDFETWSLNRIAKEKSQQFQLATADELIKRSKI